LRGKRRKGREKKKGKKQKKTKSCTSPLSPKTPINTGEIAHVMRGGEGKKEERRGKNLHLFDSLLVHSYSSATEEDNKFQKEEKGRERGGRKREGRRSGERKRFLFAFLVSLILVHYCRGR